MLGYVICEGQGSRAFVFIFSNVMGMYVRMYVCVCVCVYNEDELELETHNKLQYIIILIFQADTLWENFFNTTLHR